MERHQLAFVSMEGWKSLLSAREDLAAEPLVELWANKRWPLIRRRAMPFETRGVALGLPLPPSAGKRRLSMVIDRSDIIAITAPPDLRSATRVAPQSWRPILRALDDLSNRHNVAIKVFGSLAWTALTGLHYLSEQSDIDVLLYVRRDADFLGITADLARIDSASSTRIDGELIREDGSAVNWRELHSGSREILVKTIDGVALVDVRRFLPGGLVL